MNRTHRNRIRATVSGSFRRHMRQIADDVAALSDLGVDVLSPSEPRIVDAFGDFLFVASDIHRNVRRLQARHLQAIQHSTFLWVTCPDGDIGVSTAMEIGAATVAGTPIHAATPPNDLTLRQFINCVPAIRDAVALHTDVETENSRLPLLLDPAAGADALHFVADRLQRHLELPDMDYAGDDPVLARLASRGRVALSGL